MRRLALIAALTVLPALALAQSDAPPPGADQPMPPPPGGWAGHHHGMEHDDMGDLLDKFYAANTTHDGHLTLAQAKAAGLRPVAEHFAEIDVKQRGYVTFYDIEAWHMDDMAKHLEQRAAALRAKD